MKARWRWSVVGQHDKAVTLCKTVPYDWRIHKIQKAAGQSSRRLTSIPGAVIELSPAAAEGDVDGVTWEDVL